VAHSLPERVGVNLPKITTPLTASQLRARVLAQLALLNGHAPKVKA
jgi:hypothetical protein